MARGMKAIYNAERGGLARGKNACNSAYFNDLRAFVQAPHLPFPHRATIRKFFPQFYENA